MDAKKIPAVTTTVLSLIAFSSNNIVIGVCLSLITILVVPAWINAFSNVTGVQITGKQKGITAVLLLSMVALMVYWNGRQLQQKTKLSKALTVQGDSLMTVAETALEKMQSASALQLAEQADSYYSRVSEIRGNDSLQRRSAQLIKQINAATSSVKSAATLSDIEFADLVAEKTSFTNSVQGYYDTALRRQAAKRPGLAKINAVRKITAQREVAAAERRMREQALNQAKSEKTVKIIARRAYAERARDIFLDGGMDIKVRVTGREADVLNLSYPLFSDVWTHKMEKEGLREQWREMGFRRVNLTDNYNYSVYYDLK